MKTFINIFVNLNAYYQDERLGVSLADLTPPYYCACHKPEPIELCLENSVKMTCPLSEMQVCFSNADFVAWTS